MRKVTNSKTVSIPGRKTFHSRGNGRNGKPDTRQVIIDAAMSVFTNMDFHEATMRDIGNKAGVSQAAIYRYFTDKEHLLQTIAVEQTRKIVEEIRDHLGGLKGSLSKIRKMTWWYLQFYQTNPHVAWIVYVSISSKSWHKNKESIDFAREMANILFDILDEGKKKGEIRPDTDNYIAMHLYFGGLRNLATACLMKPDIGKICEFTDTFAETFFRSVQSEHVNKEGNPSYQYLFVDSNNMTGGMPAAQSTATGQLKSGT